MFSENTECKFCDDSVDQEIEMKYISFDNWKQLDFENHTLEFRLVDEMLTDKWSK